VSHIIGVDVGGTQLRAARFDENLAMQGEPVRAESPTGQDEFLAKLFDVIRAVMPPDHAPIMGIGVGLPGPLDIKAGLLISPPNLPFKGEVPFREWMSAQFSEKIDLGNDADLAGLGEHQLGAGQGVQDMVYITVSTGVGGGIIIGGRPYSGQGQGAEIGHMVIDPNGPLCGCGHPGHLEAFAAGAGIANRARDKLAEGQESLIAKLAGGDPKRINAKLVSEAARQGDGLAQELMAQAGRSLGTAIASLMMLLNPERFVLGGGLMKSYDLLEPHVEKAIEQYQMIPRYRRTVSIERAMLGDDVGLYGAAALVRLMRDS
jgi:glucokinase